jgi:hypothetical protein
LLARWPFNASPSPRLRHHGHRQEQPASAGMMARPVIQVRSISAAVALSRPKLAHETFAAATEPVKAPPARFPHRMLPF